jgi:hypothetical protein
MVIRYRYNRGKEIIANLSKALPSGNYNGAEAVMGIEKMLMDYSTIMKLRLTKILFFIFFFRRYLG